MQALALKYRPKGFNELIGQDVIKDSLSHALDSKRLGHAYLFSGLRGSGKTSSARIFAKALLCENGISANPCGVCAHCIAASESRHLDIIELDAASHRKIDDIRELIEQTKYAPSSGRFKIFIIDEAHMLTTEASNALLKTLEEPPEYIKFILATTNPLKLPATILSRTQHFRFKPISRAAILNHLEFIMAKEQISFEPKALEILCRSGSGSLRDTLTLLDQAIIFSHENVTQKSVADMLGLLDPEISEQILKTLATCDKDELLALIKTLPSSDAEIVIDELIAVLKEKFAAGDSSFSLLIYERFFRILSEAKSMLSTGADSEFVLFITLFMMLEAFHLTDINDAITDAMPPKIELATLQPRPLAPNSPAKQPQPPKASSPQSQYKAFLNLLYDKSYDLGQIFDECVSFKGFDGSNLELISVATDNKKEQIRSHYKELIEPLAKSVFGEQVKIRVSTTQNAPSAIDKLAMSINEPVAAQITPQSKIAIQLTPKSVEEQKITEFNRLFGTPEIAD